MPFVSKKRATPAHKPQPVVTENVRVTPEEPIQIPLNFQTIAMCLKQYSTRIMTIDKSIETIRDKLSDYERDGLPNATLVNPDNSKHTDDISAFDKKLDELQKKVDATGALDKKMDELQKKVDATSALDKKMGELQKKVDALDKKLTDEVNALNRNLLTKNNTIVSESITT